jgi:hypothetical protein
MDGKRSIRLSPPLRSNDSTAGIEKWLKLREPKHSGDVNKTGQMFNSLLKYPVIVNCEADCAVGAYFHTPPTTTACVLGLGSPVGEFDCIYKAYAFGTDTASTAKIRHRNCHAGQFLYLAADLGGEIGKRPP